MTGVLDDLQSAIFGQPQHAFHIGGASAPVDGHYRRGVLGDRPLGGSNVHVEGVFFDIAEDRDGPDIQHAEGGSDERVRRNDDLISRNDAGGAQGHLESGGPAIDGNAVPGALMRGERLLERLYVWVPWSRTTCRREWSRGRLPRRSDRRPASGGMVCRAARRRR